MIDLSILKSRAEKLASVRSFFALKNVLEVDCCALRPGAPIDANIDPIPAKVFPEIHGYLHTSPEYAMKELLAAGSKDIYYLGHVFRQGESGARHNPEFCMAEWYRIGFTLDQMIDETAELLSLFFGPLPIRRLSYRDAFQKYLGLDFRNASSSQLLAAMRPYNPSPDAASWPKIAQLQFLLSHAIEPHLGSEELTALIDYPPEEAALASLIAKNGELVAERFEIYYQSIELANGYRELPNKEELRRRFHQTNSDRIGEKKEPLPIDEAFLSALDSRFPDCCGVSVGFDRALLLCLNRKKISEVLPFCWTNSSQKN
jgi:lysyl-tRNA synthetase class 2